MSLFQWGSANLNYRDEFRKCQRVFEEKLLKNKEKVPMQLKFYLSRLTIIGSSGNSDESRGDSDSGLFEGNFHLVVS